MKKITVLIFTLLSLNALAQDIINVDYISPMNFNMAAIEIDSTDVDTVKVILKEAVVLYPDKGFNFEQGKILEDLFELQKLNSLVIKFPKSLCKIKDSDEVLTGQIVSCNNLTNSIPAKVEVKGALTDFGGRLVEESEIKVTGRLSFEIAHVSIVSAEMENKYLQARVTGQLLDHLINGNVIQLFLIKSYISARSL